MTASRWTCRLECPSPTTKRPSSFLLQTIMDKLCPPHRCLQSPTDHRLSTDAQTCRSLPKVGFFKYCKFDRDGGGGGSRISDVSHCVLPAVSVNMLPRQGGHADGALQTASPQAQVMTQPPPPATPPQVPPQQQTGQQTSQQSSIPASHSQSQNNYSSTKHPQSQAAFHGEFAPTCQAHTSPSCEG